MNNFYDAFLPMYCSICYLYFTKCNRCDKDSKRIQDYKKEFTDLFVTDEKKSLKPSNNDSLFGKETDLLKENIFKESNEYTKYKEIQLKNIEVNKSKKSFNDWYDCELYRKYNMSYEWRINECKKFKKEFNIQPNIKYIFLRLSPLFELINLCVSFIDTNGIITFMYKKPYHIVNGIKTHIPDNDIIYIIDLFIYTNNLKLLFDIIQRVINDKNETLSEEGIIDIITEECKLENKLTTFFNRKDTNKIYMKYICNILFLIKESIQGIKLYDFNNESIRYDT